MVAHLTYHYPKCVVLMSVAYDGLFASSIFKLEIYGLEFVSFISASTSEFLEFLF